jgi:hypothetical protein
LTGSDVNIVLWIGGAVLVAIAIVRIRMPLARMNELDRLAENAKRYESWRGGRSGPVEETTGADVMRQMLRRQVLIWATVGVVGVVLIVAGFLVR